MRIEITRGPHGESLATLRRHDGVTVRLRGYDRAHAVPHDLSHLATERAFGLRAGVWGLVAAGAAFGSVEVVEGRPRHDWRQRSQRLLAAHDDDLGLAELLNGVVHFHALGRIGELEPALREAWGMRSAEAYPYDDAGTRAAADLAALGERWRALPADGVMVEEWALPPPGPAGTGRAATGTRTPPRGGRGRRR